MVRDKGFAEIFRKDSKCKLKVCMQEVSAVQEYSDVDLDGDTYIQAGEMTRLLTDDKAKDVFGKLKRV